METALTIVLVAIGLGFVIFLHELGHFLVAKWNRVKVEKFSIGFDPWGLKFFSRQVGETVYVLGAIPLGGYVKMLGEAVEEQEAASSDPRAYHNKSVGSRMAIISAGVIMNLILGLACFIFAYGRGGLLETPAKLGMVDAGQPAYVAGIHPGDEIVAIDGRPNVSFEDLMRTVALSGSGQKVRLTLERPGQPQLVMVTVEPLRAAGAQKPSIGIAPIPGLELVPSHALVPPPGLEHEPSVHGQIKEGDRLAGIAPAGQAPQPVGDMIELRKILAKHRQETLDFLFQRASERAGKEAVTITVPPHHFVDFGFRLNIEPISAIQQGSIAERAGFRVGDQIVAVDGNDHFDPMRLPSDCYDHAGRPMVFDVVRPGHNASERVKLTATPDATPPWSEPLTSREPLEIPGLGFSYPVGTRIVDVKEGSPAARADLKAGDTIGSVKLTFPGVDGAKSTEEEFSFDNRKYAWPFVFGLIQDPASEQLPVGPERTAKFQVGRLGTNLNVELTPEPDPSWYHPARGLRFEIMQRPLPPLSASAAVRRGSIETLDNVLAIYYMLRGLGQGRISEKNFGGPIRIAHLAYLFARSGLSPFIFFLGMLSVNLAVLNFLPIPPLDGGQMVFLIGEKLRGRPLPESVLSAGTLAGVVLVLGLMFFFIYQDIVLSFFS